MYIPALAALLLARMEVEDTRSAEEAIDFGVRATLALLQHQLVFGASLRKNTSRGSTN